AGWTFRQVPVYRAATTILIDPEAPKFLNNIQEVTPVGASAPWDPNYYPTQHEIIKSQPVRDLAIQALNGKQRSPEVAPRRRRPAVRVEPRRNTRLVAIEVEHEDPALAAEFAN